MRDLQEHGEILNLYGIGQDQAQQQGGLSLPVNYAPYLVVELASPGTLADYLGITEPPPTSAESIHSHVHEAYQQHSLSERRRLMLEVARGIESLHRHGIIHTDIKPDNILVTGDASSSSSLHAKLGDFGSVLIFQRGDPENTLLPLGRDVGGTPGYQAPEFDRETVLSWPPPQLRQLDVYSFGV
ncbi:kinase-like domain-containing protein, partial [Lasiosphaeria ovina]